MSFNVAVQDSSEIQIMLDSKSNSSNGNTGRAKSNTTKKNSMKSKSSKRTASTPNNPLPIVISLAGNDAIQDRNRNRSRRRTLLAPERKKAMRRATKMAAKKFVVFMVSTVGLSCVVVAYAIVGGFIFMTLEGNTEQKSRTAIQEIRDLHIETLLNDTWEMNIFRKEEWIQAANKTFQSFQAKIYEAVKDMGWDGTDTVSEINTQWTYAGSLLYSVTVITTIGFGHLTPKSFWGRVVTMLYGLVGIPMTLLCLANIGSFMAHCFRIMWSQIICKPCRRQLRRRSMIMAAKKAAAAKYVGDMATRNRLLGAGMEVGVGVGIVSSGGNKTGGVAGSGCGSSSADKFQVDLGAESPAAMHDSASLLGRQNPPRYSYLDHNNRKRFLTGIDGLSVGDYVSCDLQYQPEKGRIQLEGDTQSEGQTQTEGKIYNEEQTEDDGQICFKDQANNKRRTQYEGQEKGEGQMSTEKTPQADGCTQKEEKKSADSADKEKSPLEGRDTANSTSPPEPKIILEQTKKYFEYPMVTATVLTSNNPSQTKTSTVDDRGPCSTFSTCTAEVLEAEEVEQTTAESLLEIKKLKPDVVRVPITVCLVLVAAYIFLGAMMFSLWEQNWSYFDSCYFCFTTLSTIGFGDLVPGYDNKQWGNQAKRVSCTLYLLFGLALVAMCFELIQAECRQIFSHLGHTFGFLSKDTQDEKK